MLYHTMSYHVISYQVPSPYMKNKEKRKDKFHHLEKEKKVKGKNQQEKGENDERDFLTWFDLILSKIYNLLSAAVLCKSPCIYIIHMHFFPPFIHTFIHAQILSTLYTLHITDYISKSGGFAIMEDIDAFLPFLLLFVMPIGLCDL